MFDQLDPLFPARVQFAFTVSFHILFPAFTIGLASWLAVVRWRWLVTDNEIYGDVYRMWVKIFAVVFGMGVVSGVVLSYQFGTNWSVFSDRAGNILGPLLGFEVLTAFFLEASFLGIMLFGTNKVSNRMHFAATFIVAAGTLLSAFWILSANSWMQTPAGFRVGEGGRIFPTDWIQVIFNPSFPYRMVHMVIAAYLTTAFLVGGVAAFYLFKNKFLPQARIMFGMAMIMAIFVAPVQLLVGDMHGLNTLEHQPAKVSAMEGLYDTTKGAPLLLFGWPDDEAGRTRFALEVPKLSSLILTHDLNGEVKGLNEWPREDRPPAPLIFWAFRIMVGLGMLMILTGVLAIVLYFTKRLFDAKWFQIWCMAMAPAGFVSVLAGWFVTEVGRQPYIIHNVMKTAEAASPVAGSVVLSSLVGFVAVYVFIFGAGCYYIARLVITGPKSAEPPNGENGVDMPAPALDLISKSGGEHV